MKPSVKVNTPREIALELLIELEERHSYSNLLLHKYLKDRLLGPQDSAFVTELFYGTIQRKNTLDYVLNRFVSKGLDQLNNWVLQLLRLSLYQIGYMDRIPDHAAVNEAVRIAKRRGHRGISGMVNGVLRNILRTTDAFAIDEELPAAQKIALRSSHPDWLIQRWIKQYGEDLAIQMAESNNIPPALSLRVNPTRESRETVLRKLLEQGYQAHASHIHPQGIVVDRGGNLAQHPLFSEGAFSIQDESSMLVAEAVRPEAGMTVLDCCAAPGGKTTHMAEKMNNQGRVLANDIHPHKQQLIQQQAERLGLSCIETMVGDAADLKERLAGQSFDRILLDAPCSGLGVIRRKPDMKWTKFPKHFKALPDLQLHLLHQVASLLKKEGILVYSTCTVEPNENQEVIYKFLAEHPDFTLDKNLVSDLPKTVQDWIRDTERNEPGMVQILPHDFHTDGFFIARLKRT